MKIILNQIYKIEDLEKIKDLKAFKKIVLFHIKRYVLNKELRLYNAIKNYVIMASQIKNKKTNSIGLRTSTIKRYEYLLKIFNEYEKSKDKILFIDSFKIKEIDDFTDYLLNEKKYGVGTIGKLLGQIKTILYRAKRDGIKVSDAMQNIDHFGFNKTDRILNILSFEEIEKLKSITPCSYLKNSWKIMLIGLYTGQRVSDLLSLKKSQLRENVNGNLYIDFIQKKKRG